MDRLKDYKEFNISKTEELIHERMNKENKGTIKRHETIIRIINKYVDKLKPLLEVGCREGDLFILLQKEGYNDLYGIDISPLGIKILNERGFNGHIADAQEDFKLNNTFDTVIISHCLEHVPEPSKVIKNIYKCLNDNGILYVEVPKQPKEPTPTKWSHYYCFVSLEELIQFFSSNKWKLLYKQDENKNLRCIFKKIS